MASSTNSHNRKALTLAERMDVIKMGEEGKSSRYLAVKFGVGRTQILNIMKRKEEITADFEAAASPLSRKRKPRPTGNEPINELCLKWFIESTHQKNKLNGPLIQEKALQFAKELGISSFTASNGWLESFVKRNQLSFGKLSGEPEDCNPNLCHEWMFKIPSITDGYEARDIYTLAEYGLFFKTLANKSFYMEGQKCEGGQKSKERITISLCVNLAGEKENVLAIGKASRSRAFGHIDTQRLPVIYANSPKAWMTVEIFTSWINTFNEKLKKENRHVLLFLAKLPSHPTLSPSNVKLMYYPPNNYKTLQPLDQGVIQSLKMSYRKAQFTYILSEMEKVKGNSGTAVMKKIPLLNAVNWVAAGWEKVDPSTIQNCFLQAGFNCKFAGYCQDDNLLGPVPPAFDELSQSLFGIPFDDISDIDNDLVTCDSYFTDWTKPASELLKELHENKELIDERDEEEMEERNYVQAYSRPEAFSQLSALRTYFHEQCDLEGLRCIESTENHLLKLNTSNANMQ